MSTCDDVRHIDDDDSLIMPLEGAISVLDNKEVKHDENSTIYRIFCSSEK